MNRSIAILSLVVTIIALPFLISRSGNLVKPHEKAVYKNKTQTVMILKSYDEKGNVVGRNSLGVRNWIDTDVYLAEWSFCMTEDDHLELAFIYRMSKNESLLPKKGLITAALLNITGIKEVEVHGRWVTLEHERGYTWKMLADSIDAALGKEFPLL